MDTKSRIGYLVLWSVVGGFGFGFLMAGIFSLAQENIQTPLVIALIWMGTVSLIVGSFGTLRNVEKLEKFIDYSESRQEPLAE